MGASVTPLKIELIKLPINLPRSYKPFLFIKRLRRRVVSSLRKRITPQNAPTSQQNSEYDAEIADTAFGIFRTRRRIQTGVPRKFILIKTDKPYKDSLQVRLKYLPASQIFHVLRQQFPNVDFQSVVPF